MSAAVASSSTFHWEQSTRGLPAYSALRLRVFDEVRDRFRTNPYSTLVRIAAAREALA